MSTKLWGGCFSKDIDSEVLDYTLTTNIDSRLIRYDIWGSMAHLLMLNRQRIVSDDAAASIAKALIALYQQQQNGHLELNRELEDVHLNIESMIICSVGAEYGGRLHTARSRNDQVVTDTRMFLRAELLKVQASLAMFIGDLIKLARQNLDKLAVGYTHLQPAQPITLAFWYSAYASMFMRDLKRLNEAYINTNSSVLGACALAGTSFPIDRLQTQLNLGFDQLLEHSLDATSSRDFAAQALAAFALLMGNYSRMAEEIVVWSTHEFGLIEVDDAFATGSSIMPQKKNPVVAELMKGRTGRVQGALMQILTISKGVTLGYNCDLQEDKPLLWDAIDTIQSTTSIAHRQLLTSRYDSVRAEELCWRNFSTVTELANLLVREKMLPFREAHRLTGELTQALIDRHGDLRNLEFVQTFLAGHLIDLEPEYIRACVDPKLVVARQTSQGATGAASVSPMLDRLSEELREHEAVTQANSDKLSHAEADTLRQIQLLADGTKLSDHAFG